MIRATNISKTYNNVQVLKPSSVEIQHKTLTVILGPNGAGKSTLVNILGRHIKPDSGTLTLDSELYSSFSSNAFAKRCTTLKQGQVLHTSMSVYDLVSIGRYPHSKGSITTDDHAVICEAIAQCGCTQFEHQDIQTLSGGQLQKAYLAMTLAQNTDIILLDEPTSSLDIKQSIHTMELLKKLVIHEGKTVVVIAHDIQLAAKYADTIILMKDGEIITSGTVENTLTPQHLEVCFDINFKVVKHDAAYFIEPQGDKN